MQSKTCTFCRPRLLSASRSRVSMLTRRVNRLRGLREACEAALSLPLLGPLPGDLVKLILRLLPLDTRLRAREVRRGWCALLDDASFWTRVDLSKSCGVNPRFLDSWRRGLALLRAACARTKGGLLSVDLSGVFVGWQGVPFVLQWAAALSAADKASLRDLVAPTSRSLNAGQVTALCLALPLCRVRCDVICSPVVALPLLRREPPFALLTLGQLFVPHNEAGEQAILDIASALTGYKGMEKLHARNFPLATRAVVDALVDAAISAGIKDVQFIGCGLSPTALPALTRLLQSPGFVCLHVWNLGLALFEGPALPAFCEALRNCTSLKALKLVMVNLWDDMAVATQLIAALEVHPSLQKLSMERSRTDGTPVMQQAAGGCLARLIARSTCLRLLSLEDNRFGEAGMTPIFQALRNNSSLEKLAFRVLIGGELISPEFARDVVLPAVRANTGLRTLEGLRLALPEVHAGEYGHFEVEEEEAEPDPSLLEVEDILEARRLADEEAA